MEYFTPPPSPYTNGLLQEIYTEFEIPDSKERLVKDFLDDSSRSWHRRTNQAERVGSTQDALKLVRQLKRSSMKMRESIDRVSPERWENLCEIYYGSGPYPWSPTTKNDLFEGHSMSFPIGNPAYKDISLNLAELFTVLGGIVDITEEIGFSLAPQKPGRKTDFKLRLWIRNTAAFWEGDLERKFTRDFFEGAPISQAARFSVKAYQVLSPDTPASLIDTEMKKYISDMQQRKLGDNSKK